MGVGGCEEKRAPPEKARGSIRPTASIPHGIPSVWDTRQSVFSLNDRLLLKPAPDAQSLCLPALPGATSSTTFLTHRNLNIKTSAIKPNNCPQVRPSQPRVSENEGGSLQNGFPRP